MSLKDRIIANAPLRLDHYIEACLWDETDGYYATKPVFGEAGDFITAPEISQIFGEIIGLWCISKWHEMGAPEACTLLEMGAGRGVLMRDVLRVAKADPEFAKAITPTILEKSAQLRDIQTATIGQPVAFIETLADLPPQPTIMLANEFFDALPIRQFRFEDGGWLEAYISEGLTKIWHPCANPPAAMSGKMTAGVTIELCEPAMSLSAQIGRHLRAHKGAFLAIDYGDFEGFGDTLQAVKNHAHSDPFQDQGEADLTAHVRFGDIARASKLDPIFTTQGQFLNAFGGVERLQSLCTQNPALADDLIAGYHRLTAPDQMGELFKVLILENSSMEENIMSFTTLGNGVEFWRDDALFFLHGFFTRKGGVSKGEIAGLNCGRGADDAPENVVENRARVGAALGAKLPVQTVYQCHSADVLTIDAPIEGSPKCDAIVTATKGLPIAVLTADCAPILFADYKAGVIGAAHAGWRGAFGGVASNTVDAMVALGASRADIRAVVGPCISMNNYEVGGEFVEQFTDENPSYAEYFAGGDSIHFNLPRFVLDRIRDAGVENCDWVGECTYGDEARYYSFRRATHRKEADYGRLIHAIMLPA